MLRACRSVLKPGGRVALSIIFVAEELPADERRRIGRSRPQGIYTRAQQRELLRSAGFINVEQDDVTAEFLRIQRAYIDANERHANGLRRALGKVKFDDQQAGRRSSLELIESGALKRALFVGTRPRRSNPNRELG